MRAAQGVDKKLISNVSVFDVYEGKGIDPDKKSIAIAVTLQPREKTMTDEEIDALAAKIVGEVDQAHGRGVAGVTLKRPLARKRAPAGYPLPLCARRLRQPSKRRRRVAGTNGKTLRRRRIVDHSSKKCLREALPQRLADMVILSQPDPANSPQVLFRKKAIKQFLMVHSPSRPAYQYTDLQHS